MSIRLYIEGIVGALFVGALLVLWTLLGRANDHINTLEASEKAYASVHTYQLNAAKQAGIGELVLVRRTLAAPRGPVRLCQPDAVQAGTATGAGTGSTAGDVPAVRGGDSSVRPVEHPDVGYLFGLLAFQGDRCSVMLREQQTVQ